MLFEIASCNAQPVPQRKFQRHHFALVALVVVTQEMKNAMQDEPADLIQGRMPFFKRIPPGGIYRDDDITQEVFELH